jgi:hypothetical protein
MGKSVPVPVPPPPVKMYVQWNINASTHPEPLLAVCQVSRHVQVVDEPVALSRVELLCGRQELLLECLLYVSQHYIQMCSNRLIF